jgi:hypothetical protein
MIDYTSQPKDNNFSINKHSLQAVFGIPGVVFYDSVISDNLILLSARLKGKTAKCTCCGISGTVVDIRLILREALKFYASGIFLGHNHPSDNCRPSPQDIQITKKLKEATQWMDIVLLDHIIVCGDRYFSFADEGII